MPRKVQPQNFFKQSKLVQPVETNKNVTLILPPAHAKQYELIKALDTIPGCRFVVGACGTKFGKTYGCTIAIVSHAWDNPGSVNWWVGPTYNQALMAYDYIIKLLPKDTYREQKALMRIILLEPNGAEHSVIEFKSGDNPDSLRGYAVDFFIMDEAARQPYESFVSIVTTTTQTEGKGIVISTPKGRGWFYDVYERGQKFWKDGTPKFDEENKDPFPEWYAIRMPSWSNPWVKPHIIEQMRSNLPEDVFQQEVAAEFLLDSAGVFNNINGCIRGELQPRLPGQSYVMGVDLARLRDYSVLTVMSRQTKHVVAFERFTQIKWEVQYAKIIEMAKRYGATAVMDSTGIGDPIVETIQRSGISVIPYKIGGTTAKKQLIDKLRVNIEKERISYPKIPTLVNELETYECEITETGTVRFGAPSGKHDDCVISLALANWAADTDPFIYKYSNYSWV